MKRFRQLLFICVMLLGLALTLSGCGSSSEGGNSASVSDPLAGPSETAGNIVNFTTTKLPTDPNGTLNTVSFTITGVDPVVNPSAEVVQLLPFEVRSRSGAYMPQESVQISVYSVKGGSCDVSIDSPVVSDNNGKGIFNAVVSLATPPIGSENSCSIVYKATTSQNITDSTQYYYGGFIANVKNLRL